MMMMTYFLCICFRVFLILFFIVLQRKYGETSLILAVQKDEDNLNVSCISHYGLYFSKPIDVYHGAILLEDKLFISKYASTSAYKLIRHRLINSYNNRPVFILNISRSVMD